MIRLFVAIALPAAVRAALARLQCGVAGARWVVPENLHLSLRFIGEVDGETAQDVVDALERVDGVPFELSLGGVGHFGDRRRARVLWAGVRKSEPLAALRARVERALARAGLAPEGRRFSPHVTLARLKGVPVRELGPYLAANEPFRTEAFPVTGLVLFSSHLGHTGAQYRAEAEFPLTSGMLAAE